MFQREVAERTRRAPGLEKLRPIVRAGSAGAREARILFDIAASAFVPPPKVTSSLVQLIAACRRRSPATRTPCKRVTQAAFGQRRKMLRQSLKSLGADVPALLGRRRHRDQRHEPRTFRSKGSSRSPAR